MLNEKVRKTGKKERKTVNCWVNGLFLIIIPIQTYQNIGFRFIMFFKITHQSGCNYYIESSLSKKTALLFFPVT